MGADGQAISGQTFSHLAFNINSSVEYVPGLMSALSYLLALLLGTHAVIKIKDHVENPRQTHLRESVVRLAVGGALFSLPVVYEAMFSMFGEAGNITSAASLQQVLMNMGSGISNAGGGGAPSPSAPAAF